MKHLYFVRHGETEANAAGLWSGTFETPLNETGERQAKLAGEHAKALKVDHVVCSTLGRAKQTAAIIAKEIDFPVDAIEYNSLFVERHFGEMEGRPRDFELDADIDGFVDIEAHETILERASLALEYIQSLEAENVLVVSHGSFGRALRSLTHPHLPFEPVGTDKTRFKNAEIVKLI